MKQIRQGDVFFELVEEIPADAKPLPRDDQGRVVVLEGEETGHFHAFYGPGVTMYRANEGEYLGVEEKDLLKHDEHDPIEFKKGKYKITRQRQNILGHIRYVQD